VPHLPLPLQEPLAVGGAHCLHSGRSVRDLGQVCLPGVQPQNRQVHLLHQLRGEEDLHDGDVVALVSLSCQLGRQKAEGIPHPQGQQRIPIQSQIKDVLNFRNYLHYLEKNWIGLPNNKTRADKAEQKRKRHRFDWGSRNHSEDLLEGKEITSNQSESYSSSSKVISPNFICSSVTSLFSGQSSIQAEHFLRL
jgi:hypothetical protein